MKMFWAVPGAVLILIVLWEAFETIVLPRRVTRRIRLTRLFYRNAWRLWLSADRAIVPARRKETWLSFFGPISLLLLLTIWAGILIVGFALLHFATGSAVHAAGGVPGFATDLYLSGTTFFTLGLGDVTPRTPIARAFTVVESGLGFGFLALVIGYLPALNQSFSRREVNISLLDARAGSPPTAFEMIRRHGHDHGMEALRQLLHEWERWSSELLESHLSYPVLAYFRSQHDNQSWLGALSTILDTSALATAGLDGVCARQAELTFAIARHAVVDLSQIFGTRPHMPDRDRLPPNGMKYLREGLAASGLHMREGDEVERTLAELRGMYEPYVHALAHYLRIAVPPWITETGRPDNWQTSAWGKVSGVEATGLPHDTGKEHF